MATSVSNAFSDLFYGNPFSTPVGSLVEESTESFVGPELWQLFAQVCVAVNQSASGPKDAVRAIRRRFVTSATSDETVAMHTLLLLESCVQNCGYRFHVAFATRDNLRDFVKFAAPDAEGVPDPIRQKLLSLIQNWASEFGTQVDFQEFRNVYTDLRARGVTFPPPTQPRPHTEPKTTPDLSEGKRQANPPSASPPVSGRMDQETGSRSPQSTPASTQPRQPQKPPKLDSDLAQVRVNICVLSDLVSEAEATESPVTAETKQLMSEIAAALQEMSVRLIQAISCWEAYQETLPHRGATDAVLLDMINVNDELHTVLLRYSRSVAVKDKSNRVNGDHTDETLLSAHPSANNGGHTDETLLSTHPTATASGNTLLADVNGPSALEADSNTAFSSFVGDRPCGGSGTSQVQEQGGYDEVPLLAPRVEQTTKDPAKDVSLIDF